MSDININVEGNSSVRLKTAGKYCDKDIVVRAEGGDGLDTSDATVTENDMPMGVTGYARGGKLTGNVEVVGGHNELTDSIPVWDDSKGTFGVGFYAKSRVFFEENADVTLYVKPDKLGDAAVADVAEGKTFTSENGLKLTGTKQAPVPVTQATPTITVSDSGLITAKAVQGAGLVSAGTKQATMQMNAIPATTITPTTQNIGIPATAYLTGALTIKGDANLKAENIKAGVSIFGVAGALVGGGLPDGVVAIASGTVTAAEDYPSGLTVTHNLGVAPNFCVWFVEDDYSVTPGKDAAIAGAVIGKKAKYNSTSTITYTTHYFVEGYNSSGVASGTASRVANSTYLNTTQARLACMTNYPIKAGKKIRWVVGVADGVL